MQRLYRIGGHCQFSQPEQIRAFDDLVKWVKRRRQAGRRRGVRRFIGRGKDVHRSAATERPGRPHSRRPLVCAPVTARVRVARSLSGSIQSPELERFGDVLGGDYVGALQVGDRSRHLADAIVPTRAERQPADSGREHAPRAGVQGTVPRDQRRRQLRVDAEPTPPRSACRARAARTRSRTTRRTVRRHRHRAAIPAAAPGPRRSCPDDRGAVRTIARDSGGAAAACSDTSGSRHRRIRTGRDSSRRRG